MQVILKRPGEVATVGELADLKAMQAFVEGYLETVPLLGADGCRYLIVCNDDFLYNGSKFNMSLSGVQFFGNFFICKVGKTPGGDLDFAGLDPEDVLNIANNLCWSEEDKFALFYSAIAELSTSLSGREEGVIKCLRKMLLFLELLIQVLFMRLHFH